MLPKTDVCIYFIRSGLSREFWGKGPGAGDLQETGPGSAGRQKAATGAGGTWRRVTARCARDAESAETRSSMMRRIKRGHSEVQVSGEEG